MLLRYLRLRGQLRLLRIIRGARDDDSELGLAVLRACATAEYPADEAVARDASARERERGISGFRDLATHGRQSGAQWHGPHALPPAVWPTIAQQMRTLADTNADN